MKAIVSKQPFTAGIVVTEKFRSYKSGVVSEDSLKCSDASKKINHSVTVVGYGKTESTHVSHSWCSEYWIARNNWGSTWGE